MRLAGLGAVSDATVLEAGTNLTFTVSASSLCSGVDEQDVRDTLNNWAAQMMRVNSVSGKFANWVPFYGNDFDVSATVLKAIPAGNLRSQISQSLAALAHECPGSISVKNEVISVASGGTHDPGDTPASEGGIPWSTTAVVLGVAGLAALAIVKFK